MMIKITNLVNKIESFYRKALYSLAAVTEFDPTQMKPTGYYGGDDEETEGEGGGGDLFSESEKFDIKNEELYNLFTSFMETYESLTSAINAVDPQRVSYEQLSDIAQMLDTMNTRGRRVAESRHLNVTENYEEDFDPGDLVDFIERAYLDAKRRADALSEDFDEVKENQFAQEFQELQEEAKEKGGKEEEWMARQRDANRRHSAAHREKMRDLKKLNPSEYAKWYEVQKQRRHAQYEALKNDPEKWSAYRAKENDRIQKWRGSLVQKFELLTNSIPRMPEGSEKEKALKELERIKSRIKRIKDTVVKHTGIRSMLWKVEDLSGAVQSILTKTDSAIFETKERARKAEFEKEEGKFDHLKQAIANAKNAYNQATPATKNAAKEALATAQKNLKDAMVAYMRDPAVNEKVAKSPVVLETAQDMTQVKQYVKMIESVFFKNVKKEQRKGMTGSMQVTDQMKSEISSLSDIGTNLIAGLQQKQNNLYDKTIEQLGNAVKYLKNLTGEEGV